MDYDIKRELLQESLRLLVTHDPFLKFMEALEGLRESAIADACRIDVVDNQGKVMAALGEVRSYNDLKALVSELTAQTS